MKLTPELGSAALCNAFRNCHRYPAKVLSVLSTKYDIMYDIKLTPEHGMAALSTAFRNYNKYPAKVLSVLSAEGHHLCYV